MFRGESKLFPDQSKAASGGQGAGDQYTGNRPGDIPDWSERFEYDLGREVRADDGNYYRATQDHTATNSFATDLGNGLWELFAGPALDNDDQILSLDGDGVTLRLSNGNNGGVPVPDSTVDLTPFLDNTDNQQISLQPGNILTLSNGTGPDTTVDLTPFLDNTDNQQISLEPGNILTLSNGTGPDTTVDLTPFLDNTDNQQLSLEPGNILTLSNGTGPDTTVDLSPFLDNTDDQQLTATVLPNGDIQLDLTASGTPSVVVIPQNERRENDKVFVDIVYGNDGTGVRERGDLPFQTYAAAVAAANANDTIVLRPGFYPALQIANNINIHGENGANAQRLFDNGVAVTSKITGHLDLSFGGNGAINLTGNGTNVDIECGTVNAIGVGIEVNPGALGTLDANITCDRITGTLINYNVAGRGGANLELTVRDSIESAANTNGFSMIQFGFNYTGSSIIKAKRAIIGNSAQTVAGIFYSSSNDPASTGSIDIEVDEVTNNFEGPGDFLFPTILFHNNMKVDIKVGKIQSNVKPLLGGSFAYTDGKLTFKGEGIARDTEAINWGNTGRLIIKPGSVLQRLDGGADDNKIVVIGNPPGATGFFAKQPDNLRVECKNVDFIKTSSAGTATDYMVGVDGASTETIFKDCNIIGIGVNAATPACDAAAVPEGNIYFKNTRSNKDNTANITDTAVPSGFVGNDTALNSFDV